MKTQHKTIKLNSIARNISDDIVQDGAAQDIINLRNKYGNWQPMANKKEYATINTTIFPLSNIHTIEKHNALPENEFIVVLNNVVYRGNFVDDTKTQILDISSETFLSLVTFQNVLIVNTQQNSYKLLYIAKEDSYKLISFPEINFKTAIIEEKMAGSPDYRSSIEDAAADYVRQKRIYENDGYFEGNMLIIAALKLFDGSYINYSMVKYVDSRLSNRDSYTKIYHTDGSGWQLRNAVFSKYGIFLDLNNNFVNTLENLKEIVDSVCFFQTRPVSYYKYNEKGLPVKDEWDNPDLNNFNEGSYNHLPVQNYEKILLNEMNYYKILEVPVTEIVNYNESVLYKKIEYDTNLLTFETLPVNNFSNHTVFSSSYKKINQRLHLESVKTRLNNYLKSFNIPVFWVLDVTLETTQNYDIQDDTLIDSSGIYTFKIIRLNNTSDSPEIQITVNDYDISPSTPGQFLTRQVNEFSVTDTQSNSGNSYPDGSFSHNVNLKILVNIDGTDYTITDNDYNAKAEYNTIEDSYVVSVEKESINYEKCPVASDASSYEIEVDLYIKGQKYTIRDALESQQIYSYGTQNEAKLPVILTYPDSRAKEIKIIQDGSTKHSFPLISHFYRNYAYYSEISVTKFKQGETNHEILLNCSESYTKETENRIINESNRVQVSELNNPFSYPAKNSYRFGNAGNEIIGIETITRALSPGQLGQFPIYVFTRQGVFSLQYGDGEVLYSNIIPLNKEVCISSDSITNTGKGVIFATKDGIKIISANQTQKLSIALENNTNNNLLSNTNFEDNLTKDYLVNLYDYVDNEDFQNYLENSIIEYDYYNNELIVSNNEKDEEGNLVYNYSFIYNFDSGHFWKINQNFETYIDLYPTILGLNGNILYNINEEENTIPHCLYQSRPVKLDSLGIKQIKRLAIRGFFRNKQGTYGSVYIYGSQDGINYKFLRGTRPESSQEYIDIIVNRTLASFRYAIIVIAGQFDHNTRFSIAETTFYHKYTSKLR